MAERPLCVGGVNFGFFQFFGGGSDRIGPKQAGLTGKASWFLPLRALLEAILSMTPGFGTPKFRPLEDTLAIGTSTHVCGSYHSLWVYGGLEPWPNDHCVLEGSILVFSSFSEEGPTALGRNRLALPVRPAGFFHCEHCWRRYCPLGIEGGTFGVSNTCV